jgi:pilus assembly protein FimV
MVEGSSYGPVRNGETLWPIAQALKPAGITTRQMAIALLRANPQAFVDNDINRLRAGATLTIPSRSVIEELDAAAARAEFNAQISAQRRKSPPVATSPRELQGTADRASTDTGGATEAAPASEPIEPDDAEAQLRIIADQRKVEAGSDNEEDLREQLLVTMEEIESNRLTTGAIESRLARLESELEQMQKLVELKDAQIAALQSEVSSRDAAQQRQQAAPAPTKQMTPEMQPPKSGTATSPVAESAPAVAIPAEQIIPTADAEPSAQLPWYEEYLWAIWAVLALLGLTAVLLMFRRPNPATEELPLAELPEVRNSTPPYAAAGAADSKGLRRAQESFRAVTQEPPPGISEIAIDEAQLPELDIPVARETREDIDGGVSDTLIDDIIKDSKLLIDRPQAAETTPGYSDDDIASWIKELGTEAERGGPDAHREHVQEGDEVPSLLTELDDRLASTPPEELSDPGGTQPSEDDGEDETFAMSLDLARAYLEIGDHEGAKDMLQQALAGARSPMHRQQIEDLLQQID